MAGEKEIPRHSLAFVYYRLCPGKSYVTFKRAVHPMWFGMPSLFSLAAHCPFRIVRIRHWRLSTATPEQILRKADGSGVLIRSATPNGVRRWPTHGSWAKIIIIVTGREERWGSTTQTLRTSGSRWIESLLRMASRYIRNQQKQYGGPCIFWRQTGPCPVGSLGPSEKKRWSPQLIGCAHRPQEGALSELPSLQSNQPNQPPGTRCKGPRRTRSAG